MRRLVFAELSRARFFRSEDLMRNLSLMRMTLERIWKAAPLTAAFLLCFVVSPHSALGQTVDPPSPAEPQHTVIPIHLNPASGDIKVGRTTYPGASPGLHMLALKRKPGLTLDAPDLIEDQIFTDASSANSFLESVLAHNSDAFLIVNGVGEYGIALSEIASNLEQFGGQVDLEGIRSAAPFVFIGNGGRDKGGALQRGFSSLTMDGYLATDTNGNYAFIQTDYVRYEIATDGTITIGNTAYPVADAGFKSAGCDAAASDSFHLLILDRESLAPQVNNAYCTGQNPSDLGYMAGDLGGVTSEGELVFVATNGYPIPSDWSFGTDGDARVYPLAQQIARLGGHFETMVYLTPTDTYSLVGAPAPPSYVARAWSRAREASSVYPDHPTGELHGILARGRGNWYGPINADLTGQANLDFYDQVLAKAPATPEVTFPEIKLASPELTAFRYISCALAPNANVKNCLTNPPSNIANPRDQYGNTNVSIENYFTKLETDTDLKSDPYNNNADCTDPNNPTKDSPYCTVRAQLLIEFQYVTDIRALASNFKDLGTISGVDSLFDLINTWQTVQATLPAPQQPTAQSLVSPIVNLVLGLAGAAPTPLAPLFGLADTFFNFGMSLTTDQSGNQTASLATPVANLADQAQKNFSAQLNSLGTQFDLIYQDWGKLQALGTLLQSGDPAWAWGVSTASDISNSMNPAVKQGMYQSLMSAVYAIGSYLPEVTPPAPYNGWGNFPVSRQPNGYQVLVNRQSPYVPLSQPFDLPRPSDQLGYIPYTYPTDPGNPWADDPRTATLLSDYSWLGISAIGTPVNGTTDDFRYSPPGADLLTELFNPLSHGGLGVYRPSFFHTWPFPRLTCTLTFGDYNGYSYPGGCDWNSGTAPVETIPRPLGHVSSDIVKMSRYRDGVKVRLAIHNAGAADIPSIEISEIVLRTVAGTGEATILTPLPIRIEGLGAGSSVPVVLYLKVPARVEELGLTVSGAVDNGDSSFDYLSLTEVITPNEARRRGFVY